MKNKILHGDALTILKTLPSESIDCVVTSPPYWGLRDYGIKNQIGLEKTPEEYVNKLVEIFREIRRTLKKEGTCWLNLGDSYASGGNGGHGDKQHSNRGTRALAGKAKKAPAGLKSKDIVGIPWRVAFALQADGWYLRQDIIWAKPNPMPESVTDRCTKSHEYIFLLTKSPKYYFDNEAIKEKSLTFETENRPMGVIKDRLYNDNLKISTLRHKNIQIQGRQPHSFHLRRTRGEADEKYAKRNKRSVWTVTTQPYRDAHFATFPEDLIIPMVKAGCPEKGIVLDPFMGAGTTAVVARKLGRNYLGIELNSGYIKMAERRMAQNIMFAVL